MNLNFDEGLKEFEINGDPNRVIRFNPNDLAFAERYENAREKALKLAKKYEADMKRNKVLANKNPNNDVSGKILKDSNKEIRDLINSVFDDNVADIIFGRTHPLTVANGNFLVLNFLNALNSLITESMNESLSDIEKSKIEDYKKQYDSLPS